MTRDELFALSDERDAQLRRLLDAERAAYLLGYAAGRQDQAREADRAWAALPLQPAPAGPTLAEAEAARWRLCARRCRSGDRYRSCEESGHARDDSHPAHPCTACEQRTRETFADPHPDDYQGHRQEHAA